MRESRFFQDCGTFNTNQNKKYHNFERIKICATVFLEWRDFRHQENVAMWNGKFQRSVAYMGPLPALSSHIEW